MKTLFGTEMFNQVSSSAHSYLKIQSGPFSIFLLQTQTLHFYIRTIFLYANHIIFIQTIWAEWAEGSLSEDRMGRLKAVFDHLDAAIKYGTATSDPVVLSSPNFYIRTVFSVCPSSLTSSEISS